ncbi:MAG: hypothetical protein JOY62_14565 [Acidobacteriaceae bacterium]|nr:hypothetical protein [Acidobacteriaceae bacterium]MBV9781183.1 hypothetical protein [Acidobacteriaceae bacterium]
MAVVWCDQERLRPAFYSGVDAHFERGDAEQPRFGVGQGLGESGFFVADGLVLIEEALNLLLIASIVAWGGACGR